MLFFSPQLQSAAQHRMQYRLQIPPFMKAREPITDVLSSDPELQGLDSSKLIFTDITFGVKDRVSFWMNVLTTFTSMDPSTCPMRSPMSINQRREMLLFLAQIFVSHAGITNNGLAHTDSVLFCHFWFNRPNTAKWLYGRLQGN